jgi:hypothetical protein
MSSSSERDQSEEQGNRPGFMRSVMQAISRSRFSTDERARNSPSPTFGRQDAGKSNRDSDTKEDSEEITRGVLGREESRTPPIDGLPRELHLFQEMRSTPGPRDDGKNLRVIPSSESEHFSSYSVSEQERRLNRGIRSTLTATGRLEVNGLIFV